MVKKACVIAMSLALGFVIFASTVGAQAATITDASATNSVTDTPILRMKHWKNSTLEEKNSFLLGMVTNIAMNKYWMENKHGKVYTNSPTAQWVTALDGVTFADMVRALDQFVANNPGELDRAVVEVLWYTYCKPAGTALPPLRY